MSLFLILLCARKQILNAFWVRIVTSAVSATRIYVVGQNKMLVLEELMLVHYEIFWYLTSDLNSLPQAFRMYRLCYWPGRTYAVVFQSRLLVMQAYLSIGPPTLSKERMKIRRLEFITWSEENSCVMRYLVKKWMRFSDVITVISNNVGLQEDGWRVKSVNNIASNNFNF